MKIAEYDIAALQRFGYTEVEARFLYIVATHSGYFVPRQFIAFSGAKWGKRSAHFAEKIERHGHAAWREYPGTGGVYHVFARRLYGEIGKENIRNRRQHAPEFVRTRLVLLIPMCLLTQAARSPVGFILGSLGWMWERGGLG